jgi:hypothetical protein
MRPTYPCMCQLRRGVVRRRCAKMARSIPTTGASISSIVYLPAQSEHAIALALARDDRAYPQTGTINSPFPQTRSQCVYLEPVCDWW